MTVGVESAAEPVLRMMNRRMTLEQMTKALELLWHSNISVGTYWLIGHPGDNAQHAKFSLDVMRSFCETGLISDAGEIAQFIPYPGTRFFSDPEKYGVEILTHDWPKWDARGYYVLDPPEPVCQLKEFPAHDIKAFHQRFNRVDDFFDRSRTGFADRQRIQ